MSARFWMGAPLLAGLVFACRVGPDYERPEVDVPDTFRGRDDAPAPSDADLESTIGDLRWFEVFQDPALQELILRALEENYDVRVAAERVLEARAFLGITRADLYPELSVGAFSERSRVTKNSSIPLPAGVGEDQRLWSLFGDLSWEIDFWGRIRRGTEAARADLLATELARRAVAQTLVSDLALAYFQLLEFDQELDITRRTLVSRRRSLELVSLRLEQGVANKVELRQSESLVIQTAGLVPELERLIEEQENLIHLLVGGNPGPIPRGLPLLEQEPSIAVPAGLPSALLERRPDVRAAEQGLVAANARIGEAKALLYPTISLTATGGVASEDLSDLFSGDSFFWSVTPGLLMPIFNAGRLRSNVEVSESRQRQSALLYLQTLQIAFREVADALIARQKTAEVRDWRRQLEETLRDQVELSNDRYIGGVTSYLEVLDSERDHFDSELGLAQSIRDQLLASVRLYRALGGGWRAGVTDGADEDPATIP